MGEDQEWSDSSYVLRRRYRLYWSAILRNAPEGLEGLQERFSRWSVSLGFSLPNLVEESEELCIQKGEKKVYKISFPSRSSTRSFIRLSKRNIWREISKDSYSELYVYCDPAYSLRPFCDFQTMNLSTCYWVIRGISKDIESEEMIWDLIGRRNPFGEFLRRVVYIRDEEGSKGFCFLQFSSPLTSYRALKWELKHSKGSEPIHSKKKYLNPEFVGTSHVKALLLLCKGLDKYEIRTLKTVETSINELRDSDLGKLNSENVISHEKVLQGYLNFWRRSNGVPVPIDRSSEFQYNGDKRFEYMYRETLYNSGIDLFPRRDIRLYYSKSMNFLWEWNSRVFMDCQSKSLFEFDPELQSLKFIYNSGELSQLSNIGSTSGEILNDKNTREDLQVKAQISQEMLRKEREIRVASFLETARSQLNYNMNTNNINRNFLEDEYDSKRRKITQFFDISSNVTCEKSQINTSQRPYSRALTSQSSRLGAQSSCITSACDIPARNESGCVYGAHDICMWSISDGGVTEGTIGEDIGRVKSGSKNGCAKEEELICFVCCRVFGSIWERVNHEQNSLLHKYNLEIWNVGSE